MLRLTAFNPTVCSRGLSLPPSSLALFLLPASFPMSMAWLGGHCGHSTPALQASSGLSHLKLVSSSHLPMF